MKCPHISLGSDVTLLLKLDGHGGGLSAVLTSIFHVNPSGAVMHDFDF